MSICLCLEGTQDYLAGHDVTQEEDVAMIDSHTVTRHGHLNFVDDGVSTYWFSQCIANILQT